MEVGLGDSFLAPLAEFEYAIKLSRHHMSGIRLRHVDITGDEVNPVYNHVFELNFTQATKIRDVCDVV
jgi:hypothetical protein